MGMLLRGLIVGLLAMSVAGCGVRGSLDRPPGVAEPGTASAESGQGKKSGEAEKPHQGSILDGLLR
jgi:predicted small lipoprotein YifL